MHLDDEQVQRLIHGENGPEDESTLRTHLASCALCAERLREASREDEHILDLLNQLDHPVPSLTMEDLAGAVQPARAPWVRWAAGVIAALGISTAAYAAPGSPIPGWLDHLAEAFRKETPPVSTPSAAQRTGGISVLPGSSLVVVFSPAPAAAVVVVSVEDIPEVMVEAMAGEAVFTSDPNGLMVETGSGPAEYRVRIPASAPHVEIRFGADPLFTKDGSSIVTDATRNQEGHFLLALPAGVPPS